MDFSKAKWNESDYKEFINYLLSIEDENKKKFCTKTYCENEKKVLGISIPKLREIAKSILKGNSKSFIEISKNKNEYVEEVIIQGLVIAQIREEIKEKFKYIDIFVPKISNWAICDVFVSSLKFVKNCTEEYLEHIHKYLNPENEFMCRFYIVSLLYYYINEDNIDFVMDTLRNIKTDKYYIKMAAAWAICEAYIYNKEKVISFFKDNRLDKFIINKAISKINDSYRVKKEDKEYVKRFRKK